MSKFYQLFLGWKRKDRIIIQVKEGAPKQKQKWIPVSKPKWRKFLWVTSNLLGSANID